MKETNKKKLDESSDVGKKSSKKVSVQNIVMYSLLALFSAVFIWCAVIIGDYIIEAVHEKRIHKELSSGIESLFEDTKSSLTPVWTRNPQGSQSPVNTTTTLSSESTTENAPSDAVNDTTVSTPDNGTTSVPSDTTSATEVGGTGEAPSDTTLKVPSDTTVSVPSDTTSQAPDSSSESLPDSSTVTDTVTEAPTSQTTTTLPPPEITTAPEDTTPPEDESQYSEKFKEIRKEILNKQAETQNPDLFGFILIPSLGIEYPIVNRPSDVTNLYYLTHDEFGKEKKAGAIYTDYRVNRNPINNKNLVIYGHNMRSGSMFGALSKLVTSEKLFNEAEIIIATLDGIFTYKVFSTYRTNAYDTYCSMFFNSDEDYGSFLQGIVSKAVFKSSIQDIGPYDNIITLSTCTNITDNGRYAIHGVLVSIEK